MTTPRTAASSDAMERLAEAGAPESVPPVLPDASGWVKRAPGDVIEAGTPFIVHGVADQEVELQDAMDAAYWTPPPVPREPWHDLSTDREKPTLAKVTYTVPGKVDQSQTARVYHSEGTVLDEWDYAVAGLEQIASVELLHTYDPVTHVPVERALIDEAAQHHALDTLLVRSGFPVAARIIHDLAALADAAVSKDADQ